MRVWRVILWVYLENPCLVTSSSPCPFSAASSLLPLFIRSLLTASCPHPPSLTCSLYPPSSSSLYDDDFEEYNPHPYQGCYDIALTYGSLLFSYPTICYPLSSATSPPPQPLLDKEAKPALTPHSLQLLLPPAAPVPEPKSKHPPPYDYGPWRSYQPPTYFLNIFRSWLFGKEGYKNLRRRCLDYLFGLPTEAAGEGWSGAGTEETVMQGEGQERQGDGGDRNTGRGIGEIAKEAAGWGERDERSCCEGTKETAGWEGRDERSCCEGTREAAGWGGEMKEANVKGRRRPQDGREDERSYRMGGGRDERCYCEGTKEASKEGGTKKIFFF